MTRTLCNGKGHPGGAKNYQVCTACGERKANTAFRCKGHSPNGRGAGPLASVCMKCEGGYKRDASGQNVEFSNISATRHTFDAWMERVGATADDFAAVHRALQRYGLRAPCPDDILEEYAGHNRRKLYDLWHATVLLAHETRHAGRLGTYDLGDRSGRPGGAQRKRERAA